MQYVFARELIASVPGVKVTIASPFPDVDAKYYPGVDVIRSRRRNLPMGTLYLVIIVVVRLLGSTACKYIPGAEIRAIMNADAVIDLSGDMLTEDYGPVVGYSHFLPLLEALFLRKRLLVIGQSVGPFFKLKRLARWVLSRVQAITVRESISENLLRRMGVEYKDLRQTADLAFMLRPVSRARAAEILRIENISAAEQVRLGVSVSALLLNSKNRHIGGMNGGALDVFAEALDRVIDQTGAQVVLISHVFGPRASGDDRRVAKRLAEKMNRQTYIINNEYRAEELKALIESCDAFIGCRMHANIAALDSKVPVLAVSYSHKTLGIMKDIGIEEWVLDMKDVNVEKLFAEILRLFAESDNYRKRLESRLPDVRQRARENIDIVAESLVPFKAHSDK